MAFRFLSAGIVIGIALLVVEQSAGQVPTLPAPKSSQSVTSPQVPEPKPLPPEPQPKPDSPLITPGGGGGPAPKFGPPPMGGVPPGGFPMQPGGGMPMPPRFTFKFDPQAPLASFLPAAPKAPAKLPLWTNEDLAKVPELAFGDPLAKELSKQKAMEGTAHILAKMNHLNAKKTDGFMLALIEQRSDLRGMPFLMGEECRTREEQARAFHEMANFVNQAVISCKVNPNNLRAVPAFNPPPQPTAPAFSNADQLWTQMGLLNTSVQAGTLKNGNLGAFSTTNKDHASRAMVAAVMQILMPEPEYFRAGLAKFLATVPHQDATAALAKLALYSPEDSVRNAAIDGLRTRREKDYTDVLLQGFRYPLPAVSKRAAEALVKLERKDLLVNLIGVLEQPDPRLPVTEKRDGKEVTFVREMVKVNHHRNCALCHAPGNTDNVPDGVLTVAVPLPTEPLPKPTQGGYQSVPPPSPDIIVRLDMTYLRQDFSVMMPVGDAHPWPEMQRFDFLVRTRTLTASEAQAYEPCCEMDEPGRLSPHHRAALYALRELTGRDTEPTAVAWRKLLKLPK